MFSFLKMYAKQHGLITKKLINLTFIFFFSFSVRKGRKSCRHKALLCANVLLDYFFLFKLRVIGVLLFVVPLSRIQEGGGSGGGGHVYKYTQ